MFQVLVYHHFNKLCQILEENLLLIPKPLPISLVEQDKNFTIERIVKHDAPLKELDLAKGRGSPGTGFSFARIAQASLQFRSLTPELAKTADGSFIAVG